MSEVNEQGGSAQPQRGNHVLRRLQELGTGDAQRLVEAFNARYPYVATLGWQAGSEASEVDQKSVSRSVSQQAACSSTKRVAT